jgi:hypothetical protein
MSVGIRATGGRRVDVRIGVQYTAKEIEVDLGDASDTEAVQKQIDDVLTGDTKVLWLTDRRGRKVGVPAEKIAYVEVGTDSSDRRIGFVG